MKKDINLLFGLDEEKKKSSSSMNLILGLLVFILIGVMIFLFVSAKTTVNEKKDLLTRYENESSPQREAEIVDKETEYNNKVAAYDELVNEVIKEITSGQMGGDSAQITNKFLEVLYDNYVNSKFDTAGDKLVVVNSLSVDSGSVNLSCQVKTYQAAWDFVDYLRGKTDMVEPIAPIEPVAPVPPVADADGIIAPDVQAAYDEAKAKYDTDKAKYDADYAVYKPLKDKYDELTANSRYFTGVIENYPGLPTEGDGENYDISLSINFEVHWEEFK